MPMKLRRIVSKTNCWTVNESQHARNGMAQRNGSFSFIPKLEHRGLIDPLFELAIAAILFSFTDCGLLLRFHKMCSKSNSIPTTTKLQAQ
jgi:hypothetical protein